MTPRQKQLIERLKGHPFVKQHGGNAGIVGSYGKGAELDVKQDTNDVMVIANTDDIDLEKERVIPEGADPHYFKTNKQMFADHKYDIESGAGSLRSLSAFPSTQNHRSWRLRVRLRNNPIGNAIKAIVEDTNQIGTSVGFVPISMGPPNDEEKTKYGGSFESIVRAWEWFETSFTLLPCNVACQSMDITEGKSFDMVDSADRLLCSNKIDREAAYQLGMPIDAERRHYAIPTPKRVIEPPRTLISPDGTSKLLWV